MSYIMKMLDLSATHLTKNTYDLMQAGLVESVVYFEKDYGKGFNAGFIIHVSEDLVAGLESFEVVKTIPKDLLDCIMFAAGKGCAWINLDPEGEVEGLPVYAH